MNNRSSPSSKYCVPQIYLLLAAFFCICSKLLERILFAFICDVVAYVMCDVCLWMPRCAMNCGFCPLFLVVVMVHDQLAGLFLGTK